MKDAVLGQVLLSLIGVFVVYYTFWVVVLPVLPQSEHNLLFKTFPDITYALATPAILGLIFLGGLSLFTLYHLRLNNNSKQLDSR